MRASMLGVGLLLAAAVPVRADDAAVKELLDQAARAVGGKAKSAQMSALSLKAKAKISMNGFEIEFTGDMSAQGFDRLRMDMAVNVGGMSNRALLVMNGDKIWGKDSNTNKVEEAPKEVAAIFQQVFASMLLPADPAGLLGNKDLKLIHGGESKVNDVVVSVLRIARKDRPDISVYYDKKTGMAIRAETQIKEPEAAEEKTFQFQFTEYKETRGVKHVSHIKVLRDNVETVEIELSDFKVGEKFEASTFEKP